MNKIIMAVCSVLIVSSTSISAGYDKKIILKKSASSLSLIVLGTYESGLIDESAAEIVAYDAKTKRAFVTNATNKSVDVLSIKKPHKPKKLFSIDISPYGSPNSVSVYKGIVAVAVENSVVGVRGQVIFFNTSGEFINKLEVGFLPDMLTFSNDGSKLVVANEGEPNDNYSIDPVGSISVINVNKNIKSLKQTDVLEADFTAFNNKNLDRSIRIFGPNASVAQDLEPEYVAINADSSIAYVSLQENNAIALVDLATATVTNIIALGTKDYNSIQTAMDASDKDKLVNIKAWPVKGFYQPDSIDTYEVNGQTYILSANEGDARDYDGFSEEVRVGDLTLDSSITDTFPDIQNKDQLGRLKTTTVNGDLDGDGDVDQIYAYGGRSFSIWSAETGKIIYDSGSDFERITSSLSTDLFNAGDKRSDDKGPEPEALTIGRIGENTYAFIGLERTGGIMVYDITNPYSPLFVEYVNNTIIGGDVEAGTAGDVGPESFAFISAKQSPNKKPLLIVANEVSGTTTVYQIKTNAK